MSMSACLCAQRAANRCSGTLPGFHLKVPPQTYMTYVCICLRQHCSLCSPLTEHRQSHTLKAVSHQMWITHTWIARRLKLLEVCARIHTSVCKQQRRITDVLGDMMLSFPPLLMQSLHGNMCNSSIHYHINGSRASCVFFY